MNLDRYPEKLAAPAREIKMYYAPALDSQGRAWWIRKDLIPEGLGRRKRRRKRRSIFKIFRKFFIPF